MSAQAQKFVQKMIDIRTGYTMTYVIDVAIKSKIFESLKSPQTVEALASACSAQTGKIISAGNLKALLRVLVTTGFVRENNGQYTLSTEGKMLNEMPWQTMGVVSPLLKLWPHLESALAEGKAQWYQLGMPGDDIFQTLYSDPAKLRGFCEFMNANAIAAAEEVCEILNLRGGGNTLLDIAGGMGAFSCQMIHHYRWMRAIIMELPAVCELAREYIQEQGLDGYITVTEGDLFAGDYPAGANIAVLSWVLHDWDDEKARLILHHTFEALPSGGRVFISECLLSENGGGKLYGQLLSLVMLLSQPSGARERTKSEYEQLLRQAGFQDIHFYILQGPRDLIIATRP
jgi:hypothetical protein